MPFIFNEFKAARGFRSARCSRQRGAGHGLQPLSNGQNLFTVNIAQFLCSVPRIKYNSFSRLYMTCLQAIRLLLKLKMQIYLKCVILEA